MPDNSDNLNAKETIELMKEFANERSELVREVTKAVATLEKVRQDYTKPTLSDVLKQNIGLFLWVVILIIAIAFILILGDRDIKIGNNEIKSCKSNSQSIEQNALTHS